MTEFPIPSPARSPIKIAVGPDGNIWYTEDNLLSRVTTGGVITEFPLAGPAGATGLSAGIDRRPPDRLANRLWFTQSARNSIAFMSFR